MALTTKQLRCGWNSHQTMPSCSRERGAVEPVISNTWRLLSPSESQHPIQSHCNICIKRLVRWKIVNAKQCTPASKNWIVSLCALHFCKGVLASTGWIYCAALNVPRQKCSYLDRHPLGYGSSSTVLTKRKNFTSWTIRRQLLNCFIKAGVDWKWYSE